MKFPKLLPQALGVLCLLLLASCAPTNRRLYSWHNYESATYAYTRSQSPERLAELIKTYERLIERQTAERHTPPPGICAEYGYLLLKTGKKQEGLEMLKREINYYPESEIFITRIINQFS